jgi:hypothetical protein
VDIVKKDTVLQETTVVATVVGVTVTTEGTARGTRVGIENEAVVVVVVVVVVVDDGVVTEMVIDTVAEEGTTMIRVVDPQGMTTVDATTAAVMMISQRLVEVTETTDHRAVSVAAAEERAEMEWVLLNEGPQRPKARYR